jgi:hypothetical protein
MVAPAGKGVQISVRWNRCRPRCTQLVHRGRWVAVCTWACFVLPDIHYATMPTQQLMSDGQSLPACPRTSRSW